MKSFILGLFITLSTLTSQATIHTVLVWDGYYQFVDADITIQLGDTVQWLPLDYPSMVHTVTSAEIPEGALSFDYIWQAPADTFFQYVPEFAGVYNYVCTPHVTFNMIGSITVLDGTTDVSENKLGSKKIMAYPNPVVNSMHINNELIGDPFKIFNIEGQLMMDGNIEEEIDLLEFKKGIYILEVRGKNPYTHKFIKE